MVDGCDKRVGVLLRRDCRGRGLLMEDFRHWPSEEVFGDCGLFKAGTDLVDMAVSASRFVIAYCSVDLFDERRDEESSSSSRSSSFSLI